MPLDDVIILPEIVLGVTIKIPFPYAMSYKERLVPEVLEIHVEPSDEVRIVPDLPTATKVLFAKVILLRSFPVLEVFNVHKVPFDEVKIEPLPPTTTNELLSEEIP